MIEIFMIYIFLNMQLKIRRIIMGLSYGFMEEHGFKEKRNR